MTPTCVSIVIPTRNEAGDIAGTLDAIVALDYDHVDAIVVDASSDSTSDIVARYQARGVQLIRQTRGRGRAAARNEGILAAHGEIVIVLNADVRLPADFVSRILAHYGAGADYVLVESRVSNLESATARYIQALHELQYPARPEVEARMNWTEGFSCRREAALTVGLFPEGELAPLVAGEDGWFGEKLEAARYRKVFDRRLVVMHVAPPRLKDFWRQRMGRGRGWPQILRERHGWPDRRIAGVASKVAGRQVLALACLAPSVRQGWRLAARSPRGRRDWLVLSALDWLDRLATLSGLVAGVRR